MAEKNYYRSFGRGGGLGTKMSKEVQFDSSQFKMEEDNNLLKRKKDDILAIQSKTELEQSASSKKVKKVNGENSSDNFNDYDDVNPVEEIEMEDGERGEDETVQTVQTEFSVTSVYVHKEENKNQQKTEKEVNKTKKNECNVQMDTSRSFSKTGSEKFKVFDEMKNVVELYYSEESEVRPEDKGVQPRKRTYFLNYNTNIEDLISWSSKALILVIEIWHEEANVVKETKYHEKSYKELKHKVLEIAKWLKTSSEFETIDSEISTQGFFHSETEDWEIETYEKEQLAYIIREQFKANNIYNFFEVSEVDELRQAVFYIRDLIVEREFSQYYQSKEKPIHSFEVTIKKKVILKSSFSKNKYDPEDLYVLSCRTFLQEIKQWPDKVLQSFIKNWGESTKRPANDKVVRQLTRTKLEYEVRRIRKKLKTMSSIRRSPRLSNEEEDHIGVHFSSRFLEVKNERKIQFNYYTLDEQIEDLDVLTGRELLRQMNDSQVIKVDANISGIKDENIHGYLLGAKDTLRELQEGGNEKVNYSQEERSESTEAIMQSKLPFSLSIKKDEVNSEEQENENNSEVDQDEKNNNENTSIEPDIVLGEKNIASFNTTKDDIFTVASEITECDMEDAESIVLSSDDDEENESNEKEKLKDKEKEENKNIESEEKLREKEKVKLQEQKGDRKVTFSDVISTTKEYDKNDAACPKTPNEVKDFGNLPHSGHNLRGLDIGRLSPKIDECGGDKHQVVQLKKNVFYVRAKLAANNASVHAPSLIRKFFRILRQADPTTLLLPFQEDEDDNGIITDDKQLPSDQNAIDKWAAGIHMTQFNKLNFSLRISNTLSFKELKNTIIQWCMNNKCWVSFDHIKSSKIFSAGWIKGIHPILYNRSNVKQYITSKKSNLMNKINVYTKSIWQTNKDGKRTLTEAMVIDGSYEERDEILESLFQLQWKGVYKDAAFIPFKLTPKFSIEHQSKAMMLQNEYLKTLYSKTVECTNTDEILKSEEGGDIKITNWLMAARHNGESLLEHAEIVTPKLIRIIYKKENEEHVRTLMIYMFDIFAESFGREVAIKMLGPEKNYRKNQRIFNLEERYSDACARNLESAFAVEKPYTRSKRQNVIFGTIVNGENINNKKQMSYANAVEQNNQNENQIQNTIGTNTTHIKHNQVAPNVVEMSQNEMKEITNNITKEVFDDDDLKQRIVDVVNETIKSTTEKIQKEMNTVQRNFKSEIKETSDKLKKNLNIVQEKFQSDIEETSDKLTKLILEKEDKLVDKINGIQNVITTTQQEANIQAVDRYDSLMQAIAQISNKNNIKAPSVVEPIKSSHRGVKS